MIVEASGASVHRTPFRKQQDGLKLSSGWRQSPLRERPRRVTIRRPSAGTGSSDSRRWRHV